MAQEEDVCKKQTLYELACILVMNGGSEYSSVSIDDLEVLSNSASELQEIFNRSASCDIEEWRLEDAAQRKRRAEERKVRRGQNIEHATQYLREIEAGSAVGILEHYARIWLGLFSDVSSEISPKERLTQEGGNELADSIIEGFKRVVHSESYFQNPRDIAESAAKNTQYYRAYLMLVAMDILAEEGAGAVLALPESTLLIALTYEIASLQDKSNKWSGWILDANPALVKNALEDYWRIQIHARAENIVGFYVYKGDEPRLKVVAEIMPVLLRSFPQAPVPLLKIMLLNVVKFGSIETIKPLVEQALKKRYREVGQRIMWLATGFILDQRAYQSQLKKQLNKSDDEKWFARNILVPYAWQQGEEGSLISSIQYRKFVIEILGSHFQNVSFRSDARTRWVSDQDEPTVADEIRRILHAFAQDPSLEAAKALDELDKNPQLAHWRTDILYTTASQIRTAREARFTYPDVADVVSTLSNAEPANVSDLKALVIDALNEVAGEIRHGNTDGYKSFWNIGGHGKATDAHVDENTARDRLLELLRPKLKHLDIVAEPEALYADEKRADIAIYCRGMKLPIEIKRDDHKQVWTAAENQLKKQYARDPASEGNGVFLVIWFDGKFNKKPPTSIKRPENAAGMKEALDFLVPEASSGLIDVVVIDASVPKEKQATKKPKPKKVSA